MSMSMSTANPFEVFRLLKSAVLSSSLRSAEKALRSAEAARRSALEETITNLNRENQNLQKQMAQTATSAAESSAMAQQLANPPPIPPAAQPQYGAMAMGGMEGQPGQAAGAGGQQAGRPM